MQEEKQLRRKKGKRPQGGELRQEQTTRREEGRLGGNGGETNRAFRLVALLILLLSENMWPAGLGLHAGGGMGLVEEETRGGWRWFERNTPVP